MIGFEGKRVTRSYVQTVRAPADRVFPLLCPVRERDWARGWTCEVIFSESGLAEEGCVFLTPSRDGPNSVWVMTRRDSESLIAEFVKTTPGHSVTRIRIALTDNADATTTASVTYTVTALSHDGNAFVDAYTQESFDASMRAWEDEINHYLATGRMLGL